MNRLHSFATSAVLAAAVLSLPTRVSAGQINWSGLSSSGLNWSDAANWDPSMPGSHDSVYFGELSGYTNVAGAVNNIVDANIALGSAWYTAQALSGSIHFYTTLIPPGVTLTLGGLGSSFPALAVGDVPGQSPLSSGNATNYSTIKGAGSLVVNDSGGLFSVGMRNRATLDLSGLSSVTANLSQLWVAASPDNPFTSGTTGFLLLGQTNNITTAANPNAPGILLGSMTNGSGTATMLLGYKNTFNTDALVVGGLRAGFGTALQFGLAASNTTPLSTFTLRGSDGISAAPVFSIGDLAAEPGDFNATPFNSASSSSANFAGGNVDILVDSLYIGRSSPGVGLSSGTSGTGTLLVENGTVTATNVYMSYKVPSTNNTAGNGVLILRSNATMNVVNDFYLCFRTNGSVFLNQPILAISNNAVLNIGGNLACTNVGGWSPAAILMGGSAAINMTGGGYVVTPILNGVGSITGSGAIVVTNALSINTDSSVGTLNLGNNLTLANPFRLTFNLGTDNTVGGGVNDYLNVANNVTFNNNPLNIVFGGPLVVGTYKLIGYGGTQSGSVTWANPTRSPIGLLQGSGQVAINVTNFTPATLTWKGTNGVTGAWDSTTTNWNNNTDRFFALDSVVFDDTGAATNVSIAGTTNFTGSITFNNSVNKYTITQSGNGAIGGYAALNKNGTGTLAMGGGGLNNYFTGPVNLNQGIIQIASFNTGVLGINDSVSPINIADGAMLDMNGNSIGTGGTYGRAVNFAGSGIGGIGAIVHNGISSSPSLTTRNVTLTGDATIGCTTAGLRLTIVGMTTPYLFTFDLAGHTLTTTGAGNVALGAFIMTNAGSINVNSTTFTLGPSSAGPGIILDGPGTINVGNKTLAFGSTSGAFTAGYVAKAISVTTGAITTPTANATPIPLLSPISIADGGSLSITNVQPLLASGVISGNGSVTKYGTSNLVLSAVNTYTGPTVVNAGGLAIGASGSIANSPLIQINPGTLLDTSAKPGGLTLAPGQTLNFNGSAVGDLTVGSGSTFLGSGVIAGSLTVLPGAEVAPATTNVTGTIVVSNNLALAGGHFTWEMAPSFDISDALVVGGNLILTGTNTFTVSSIGGFDPSGTNTLITYSGTLTGGLTNLALNSSARFAVEFVNPALTPGAIKIRLVTPSPNIVWTGTNSVRPTYWDVKTTTNWNNGGTPDIFWSSDAVTFDDTAGTNVVDLIGTLGPSSVEMANNSAPYLFRGAGALVTSSVTNDGVGMVISNTANNFFTGAGLVLNSGTVTFSQPTNVSLTANLVGSGTFTKAGNSNLTLIGNSANFFGPFNISAGTLRAGSSNVLGSGNATVSSSATLDVNGQILTSAASISVGGAGADGLGAINNRGAGRTNALGNVILTANTTFGALSNAWGIVNGLTGGGFSLTKTNVNDVWIMTGADTDLGNLNVNQGRLVFSAAGTTLGRSDSNAVVFPNATLAFATTNAMPQTGFPPSSFNAGNKPIVLQSNAILESIGFPVNQTSTNIFSGPITITNNAHFRVGGNSQLILNGPISGTNGQLILTNGGTLFLTGTNTYTSNTLVYSGTLLLTNAASLPTNTVLVLSNNIATGNPLLQFASGAVFPTNNIMRFTAVNGIALVGGDGTWNGPIFMFGSNTFQFSGGQNLLNLSGPLITTNAGGSLQFHGSNTRVAGSLRFSGSVTFGVGDGLGAGFDERFTTVRFDNTNNWTSVPNFERGRIIIGTNNALPPGAAFSQINGLSSGISDRRVIFDLNGYNQTLSFIREVFPGGVNGLNLIGNSSTNSDSIFTYAGTGTNIWGIQLVDTLDNPEIPHKLGLTVTSGLLELLNANTYTGPTLVSGGKLLVGTVVLNTISTLYGSLDATPVTVNGTGTFGGNGTVAGNVTIGSGGTLVPGDSYSYFNSSSVSVPLTRIGQLTLMNTDLSLGPGSRGIFEVDLGAHTNDQVVGIGTLTYGGSLVVSNIGAQVFTNGTVVKLFDAATYVAGPVAIQPNSPGPGLMWDTSTLVVNGTLHVTTIPTLANPSRSPDGNISFEINGSLGQGYTVLGTTNIALPMANWTILQSGTITTTPYVFTDLNATNYPLRFYGVSSP